jgi:hypothetical protein
LAGEKSIDSMKSGCTTEPPASHPGTRCGSTRRWSATPSLFSAPRLRSVSRGTEIAQSLAGGEPMHRFAAAVAIALSACTAPGPREDGGSAARGTDSGSPERDAGPGSPDSGHATSTCVPGVNTTCTATTDPWWILEGRCGTAGTCTCVNGFVLDPTTGRCRSPAGPVDGGPLCERGHPSDCGDSVPWGLCNSTGRCDCLVGASSFPLSQCTPSARQPADGGAFSYYQCTWGQACAGGAQTFSPDASDYVGYCPQESSACSCPPEAPRDLYSNRCWSDAVCLTDAGLKLPAGGAPSLGGGTCNGAPCAFGCLCGVLDAGAGALCLCPELLPGQCLRPNCGAVECFGSCTCVDGATSTCSCS